MLVELLYCSVSTSPVLAKTELFRILESARRRNLEVGITGMLLYYRGEFVQILEGRQKAIENIYLNFIGLDARHTALNKVCQNTILIRSFSEWTMGFVGEHEIQSRMPFTLAGILMNMMSEDAKTKPLSIGTSAFISIYNQMRKSPYN